LLIFAVLPPGARQCAQRSAGPADRTRGPSTLRRAFASHKHYCGATINVAEYNVK
jgi:hypothetical protein